nr:helix-turn-helix transcriptional regulator [Nocardia yamanashiensis]
MSGIQAPSFGDLLRRLRDARGISREKLAMAMGVSASYVTRLERGGRNRPTAEVVQVLIRELHAIEPVSDEHRRHLYELAELPLPNLPTVAELRAGITGDMLRLLRAAEPSPAMYFDCRYNVLAYNDSYAAVTPGIGEIGNVLHWYFAAPEARTALPEWDYEAANLVAGFRAMIAITGNPEIHRELLAEMSVYPEFRAHWDTGMVFERAARPMYLRESGTGKPFPAEVNSFIHESAAHPGWIWFLICRRLPEAGS